MGKSLSVGWLKISSAVQLKTFLLFYAIYINLPYIIKYRFTFCCCCGVVYLLDDIDICCGLYIRDRSKNLKKKILEICCVKKNNEAIAKFNFLPLLLCYVCILHNITSLLYFLLNIIFYLTNCVFISVINEYIYWNKNTVHLQCDNFFAGFFYPFVFAK